MMFSRLLVLSTLVVGFAATATVTVSATSDDVQLVTNGVCPPPRKFKMACYKCGQELDCIIDDRQENMLFHGSNGFEEWEKKEIVRVLKIQDTRTIQGTFCSKQSKTTTGQQNCDTSDGSTLEFAFRSDNCHIPQPVIGDSNKCPITGKYGLSNWAAYEIELSTLGGADYGKECCHGLHNYREVSHVDKCDTNAGCQGKCSFCEDGYTSGELGIGDEPQCGHASMPPLTQKAKCEWSYQPTPYVISPNSEPSDPADPSDPSDPSDPADPDDGSPSPPDDGSPAPPDDGEPSIESLSSETTTTTTCDESTYLSGTADEVCPASTEPVITVERDNDGGLGFNPIDFIYGLQFDTAAKTVTFKVENPLAGDADLYVSYSKPASILNDEPDCVSSIDQPRCFPDAQPITAYCDQMDGAEALLNIYIASKDTFLADVGQVATVKECCYPPENKYDDTFSVIEYAVTIKCDCPATSTTRKLLRSGRN